MFDLEMMKEVGYCHGIENYSRHLSARLPGEPPPTTNAPPAEGIVSCINVYESMKPWPTGTVIKALRIVQLFPKATPVSGNHLTQLAFTQPAYARLTCCQAPSGCSRLIPWAAVNFSDC